MKKNTNSSNNSSNNNNNHRCQPTTANHRQPTTTTTTTTAATKTTATRTRTSTDIINNMYKHKNTQEVKKSKKSSENKNRKQRRDNNKKFQNGKLSFICLKCTKYPPISQLLSHHHPDSIVFHSRSVPGYLEYVNCENRILIWWVGKVGRTAQLVLQQRTCWAFKSIWTLTWRPHH